MVAGEQSSPATISRQGFAGKSLQSILRLQCFALRRDILPVFQFRVKKWTHF
jgi:hypothetical protein